MTFKFPFFNQNKLTELPKTETDLKLDIIADIQDEISNAIQKLKDDNTGLSPREDIQSLVTKQKQYKLDDFKDAIAIIIKQLDNQVAMVDRENKAKGVYVGRLNYYERDFGTILKSALSHLEEKENTIKSMSKRI